MSLSDRKTHPDLLAALKLVYAPSGLKCSEPQREKESAEYGAYTLEVGGSAVVFRVSKITPTKIGQFVTIWKRIGDGPIQPYDSSDPIDFFVIGCRQDRRLGHFVFPRSVLCERGIVSINGKEGKRGIRIYPPWDKPVSRQALQTQSWQLRFFLEIPEDQPVDQVRVRMLYNL